jgi:hypothetical protein
MILFAFLVLLYVVFLFFSVVKKDIKNSFGRKHGRIFLILAFLIGPFTIGGLTTYTCLISSNTDYLLMHELV